VCCLFFSKAPLEETIGDLRRELEQCLVSNKDKREQVHKLETELGTVKNQLKDQEIKAQRMERIAQEHEVEIKYLRMFLIIHDHILCFIFDMIVFVFMAITQE